MQKELDPEISLIDSDFSDVLILSWFDSDDVLDETRVQYGEHFTLDGSEIEVFSIEPYLRIRHRCFDTEREDYIDLREFQEDQHGVIHLGDIVLKHDKYIFGRL